MNDNLRWSFVVIGAIMLAATVAVGSYVYFAGAGALSDEPKVRKVEDLLSDCHAKMQDLQESLNRA